MKSTLNRVQLARILVDHLERFYSVPQCVVQHLALPQISFLPDLDLVQAEIVDTLLDPPSFIGPCAQNLGISLQMLFHPPLAFRSVNLLLHSPSHAKNGKAWQQGERAVSMIDIYEFILIKSFSSI